MLDLIYCSDEKLKIVEIFLNDSPYKYIVNIPKDNSSVIEKINNNIIQSK